MEVVDKVLEFIVHWPVPILLGLAYLAGLVLCVVLAVRSKAKAATLGAVAFGVLFLQHALARPIVEGIDNLLDSDIGYTIAGGVYCCCNVLQLAAAVCLVIAIQQAISPSIPKEV